ncbi:MAG: GNAT family N-acetyltransferase [Solirubrobacterales bacterium]
MSAPEPTIRRELRPGDLGAIVAHHGRMYLDQYGLDSTFEGHVAASVAGAGTRPFPRENEGIWIVERDGEHAGSIGLTDEGGGLAMLRWVVLDPELRGCGLGRRLVEEVLDFAEAAGYERVALETFGDLTAAAHIYRSNGFELQWEQTGPRWGREQITYQRYSLSLASRQARAQSRSSRRAGASERPFSVSA